MSYVHGVLLQLQILHDDEYDENDGHDETHLFIVVPMVDSKWMRKEKKCHRCSFKLLFGLQRYNR